MPLAVIETHFTLLDWAVVLGYMLLTTFTVVIGTLIVDLLHGFLDPRLRTS